jgi:hypothetical protein
LLNDLDVRNDPQIVTNTLQHIQMHLDQAKNINPDLAAILGFQPLPSQMQPPPPQGPEAGIAAEQSGIPSLPNVPDNAPPEAQQALDSAVQPIEGQIA